MTRIVLVEDRETTRVMVEETLRRRGLDVASGGTVAAGRALLDESTPDLLLTDLQLPDGSGLDLLAHALKGEPRLPVLVMSAYGTIEIAVEAIKRGAYDFVPKPFDTNRLADLVEKALERRGRATDDAADSADDAGILGESEAMLAVVRAARKVAASDATVLVSGESGTGKELVARAIHGWSGRAGGPLVSVNCAAIPAELMEAEFFGSERGAFTGSVARTLGKVELASGGTLFLDEIGELPGALQAKLLRVLQERTLTRIGGSEEVQTDARIVAATNRDLETLVREGRFRDDLYYRLHVFPIHVPPLRDRREDVAVLARAFVQRAAADNDRPALHLTDAATERLIAADWPGNVRQLRNVLERAIILTDGDAIDAGAVDAGPTSAISATSPTSAIVGAADASSEALLPEGETLLDVGRRAARQAESEAIRRALESTAGNKAEAARRLGVSYKTLWSKLKEYELG